MAIDERQAVQLNRIPLLGQVWEQLASDPSTSGLLEGFVYHNTVSHKNRYWDGTLWWNTDGTSASIDLLAAQAADYSANNHKITNLTDATNPQDAVNYRTLLANLASLDAKTAVVYATSAALPANTYSTGALTLTATGNGALTVDTTGAVAVGQRILVKNEATSSHNGIYVVTAAGGAGAPYVLTRASDANVSADLGAGYLIPVEAPNGVTAGTANNGTVFISLAPSPFVLDTSAITFATIATAYSAGTGLTLSGTVFSLTIPVAITSGGTGATSAAAAKTSLGFLTQFSQDVASGSTSATVTHNLGNEWPSVTVYEKSTHILVGCGVVSDVGGNLVTLTFATAPTTGQYRVEVIG